MELIQIQMPVLFSEVKLQEKLDWKLWFAVGILVIGLIFMIFCHFSAKEEDEIDRKMKNQNYFDKIMSGNL
jgi:formate-dependent nitrite reductase membrane component NrfD